MHLYITYIFYHVYHLCTYGIIHQTADTYVRQLQSCRPEILYPQLVHDTPQNRHPEKFTAFIPI